MNLLLYPVIMLIWWRTFRHMKMPETVFTTWETISLSNMILLCIVGYISKSFFTTVHEHLFHPLYMSLCLYLLRCCSSGSWLHLVLSNFKYNQQDATLYNILYYCQCSTCFRWFLRPSSGAHKLYTQHRVYVKFACCYRYIYTRCCVYSFWAPDDGRRNCLEHVEHWQ
jgi:hypothetical protein